MTDSTPTPINAHVLGRAFRALAALATDGRVYESSLADHTLVSLFPGHGLWRDAILAAMIDVRPERWISTSGTEYLDHVGRLMNMALRITEEVRMPATAGRQLPVPGDLPTDYMPPINQHATYYGTAPVVDGVPVVPVPATRPCCGSRYDEAHSDACREFVGRDEHSGQLADGLTTERVEVGADGCGCPVTCDVTVVDGLLHTDIPGTDRTEHRDGCWNAPDAVAAQMRREADHGIPIVRPRPYVQDGHQGDAA